MLLFTYALLIMLILVFGGWLFKLLRTGHTAMEDARYTYWKTHAPIQEMRISEIQDRLQTLGEAFKQLSGNFIEYNSRELRAIESGADRHEMAMKYQQYYLRMIKERDIMLEQLGVVGDLLEDYAKNMYRELALTRRQVGSITKALAKRNILADNIYACIYADGRKRIYMQARLARGKVVTAKEAGRIVGNVLNRRFVMNGEGKAIIGRQPGLIVLEEAPNFTYKTGYLCSRKKGEQLCGDSSYYSPVSKQRMLMMISDGMGSGEGAYRQSEFLTDSMADLLNAGFGEKHAISLMNDLMSLRFQGESFATLDLCSVDLYSGMAQFVKYGAATTFIKRDRWIETIQSTSLPLGAVAEAEADVASKKLFAGDSIFLCSDGLLDCMQVENRVEQMKEYICELETENPEEMARELYKKVMQGDEVKQKDDATLLVFQLQAA